MHITTNSAAETEEVARQFALTLRGDETVAMFGGMGMGKTAFTRGLAAGLGIDPAEVSSPTFAIAHEHRGERARLYHYDMYRVETWEELDSTGFEEELGRCVSVVEWSENIENALPLPRWEVRISTGESSEQRNIDIRYITEEDGQ
ncbi:MAG: tRNA (adenosine(37)-N6)-threonylcarbamoyltransferase complex ATPase subunit type 1 TsaE [Ruminococcaceae bacterium]|nr:tRNA (adenosine(37)-N6)-threonylcarbamoyltransferase complex ATPase subunit type 1 TsaE [Oscillospiraceae bacterium]